MRKISDAQQVPRTHQFLITLTVHTTKLNPANDTSGHIGKLNDE